MLTMMKRKRSLPMLAVVAMGLYGCSDSDDNARTGPPPVVPADFTAFVQSQFTPNATTDKAGPIEVEATTFSFQDQDNPDAFTATIAAAP